MIETNRKAIPAAFEHYVHAEHHADTEKPTPTADLFDIFLRIRSREQVLHKQTLHTAERKRIHRRLLAVVGSIAIATAIILSDDGTTNEATSKTSLPATPMPTPQLTPTPFPVHLG